MGVWAVPEFRLMFDITGAAALCFLACIAAYSMMAHRRWLAYTTLASFGIAVVATAGFIGTSYYFRVMNPKPAFMAQCQLRDTRQGCLAAYNQLY